MSQHNDIVQGGTGAVALGWVVSAWTWATGGMSPLANLATLLTIALTALKLWDALKRRQRKQALDSSAMPLRD